MFLFMFEHVLEVYGKLRMREAQQTAISNMSQIDCTAGSEILLQMFTLLLDILSHRCGLW